MGREIRRVPKGWKHPEGKVLFDETYEDALAKWNEAKRIYETIGPNIDIIRNDRVAKENEKIVELQGKRYLVFMNEVTTFEDWHGSAPNPDYYRPKWTEEPTCYQVYENVSEGSPVSPVFETKLQMKNWLIAQGFSNKAAAAFVRDGWAPSFVYTPGKGVSGLGIHALDHLEEDNKERAINFEDE